MPSFHPCSGPTPERPGALPRPAPSWLRPALAVVVLVACIAVTTPVAAAGPETAGLHQPPVSAPVVDTFRPPSGPYAAGNRGIDYATTPGDDVAASAAGEVTFAGRIGPSSHVVVLHPDGLRTSYSFLDGVSVERGRRVSAGEVLGTAGAVLHYGVRAGERYVDPALLLAGGPVEVHLIPVELRRAQGVAEERRGVVDLVGQIVGASWRGIRAGAGAVGAATEDALAWAGDAAVVAGAELATLAERGLHIGWEGLRDEVETRWKQAVLLATYATQLPLTPLFVLHVVEQAGRAGRFRQAQQDCTAPTRPPPPPTGERRIVVLVAGFGSSSEGADVLGVDTAALGYAAADVVQFSYAGGRTGGTGALRGVATRAYGPPDSTGDLKVAGRRLAELLEAIGRAHPGVPVDVVAHSQGGLVARQALRDGPRVAHLLTLGTPHHGADGATANALLGTTGPGELAQALTAEATDGAVDGTSVAAAQLAESSDFLAELNGVAVPEATRVTSIAARGDLTVAGLQSSLSGATNVMVPLDGPGAHAELPGSALAQREMALALAGLGPTCRDLTGDLVLAAGISLSEDALGLAVGLGAMALDRKIPTPSGLPGRPHASRDPIGVAGGE